ncbi:hypothetical protein PEDI_13990 [Persicobacter diffluens]|uniref:Peptidase S54 rhomboid domain-containing protein n=2 Tax=Persicobacter diffluens TaxID=981 RepID=A0AAN4VWR0_9BACT|nr:hypothetical protein PEDI_13990 [Persicobacter diffluens]
MSLWENPFRNDYSLLNRIVNKYESMIEQESKIFYKSLIYTFGFVSLLWVVRIFEWIMGLDLGFLGILPRTLNGSIGVITSPLVHGGFMHLLSNTFPLLVLGIGLFYFYEQIAKQVFIWIYLVTGLWVWMIARSAYHIGASGVVYGLVAFMFFSGLLRKDSKSVAISLSVFFLYGGMVYGVLPTDPSVSWESHLLGSFAGIVAAIHYRNVPVRMLDGSIPTQVVHSEVDPAPKDLFETKEVPFFYNASDNVNYQYSFKSKVKSQKNIPPTTPHAGNEES